MCIVQLYHLLPDLRRSPLSPGTTPSVPPFSEGLVVTFHVCHFLKHRYISVISVVPTFDGNTSSNKCRGVRKDLIPRLLLDHD